LATHNMQITRASGAKV